MPLHQFESSDSRPWVRWWWLRGPFDDKDITEQLHWIKNHGFGGVELAWLCPLWEGLDPEAAELPRWLGDEFCTLLCITQRRCRELGLGCDFTFGSAWPFGGTIVAKEDASQTLQGFAESAFVELVPSSWEVPHDCLVVNHLSADALQKYAAEMAPAFEKALKEGTTTSSIPALFCDSWEIQKSNLWTESLWATFQERFGYDLRSVLDQVNRNPQIRYDHRKLVGETVCREFYATFTEICHQLGARSKIQCHGSPTDLLVSYAHADIPETEAILYNPHFSRIPASAAALAQKPVLSCETFTCLYGFKHYEYWRKEQVADLKLLADGLFAQGVNQIVWHGMPYNPLLSWQEGDDRYCEFYASVHVGPNCAFREELPAFNSYLAKVSEILKRGQTHSRLAVYLPNEDEILGGVY